MPSAIMLDDERVKAMVAMAWKEAVATVTSIIEEADLNADYFYIVQEGSFDIY